MHCSGGSGVNAGWLCEAGRAHGHQPLVSGGGSLLQIPSDDVV